MTENLCFFLRHDKWQKIYSVFIDLINERRMEPPEVESELKIYSQTYKKKRYILFFSTQVRRSSAIIALTNFRTKLYLKWVWELLPLPDIPYAVFAILGLISLIFSVLSDGDEAGRLDTGAPPLQGRSEFSKYFL